MQVAAEQLREPQFQRKMVVAAFREEVRLAGEGVGLAGWRASTMGFKAEKMGFWNCDMTFISVLLMGKAVQSDGTTGAAGAQIQVVGISYSGGASATALSDGSFSVFAMFDSDLKLEVRCGEESGVSDPLQTPMQNGDLMDVAPIIILPK